MIDQQPLYKAVFHYLVRDVLSQNGRSVGLLKRIEHWLDEQGRGHHHVMSYINDTLDHDAAQLAVVLNDRDTAMLLKLSLS